MGVGPRRSGATGYAELLRDLPAFRWLVASRTVSNLGDSVQHVALLWLASQSPNPGLSVALVGLALTAPSVVIAPFAGVLTDRVDRRRLLVVSDAGSIATALLIPAAYLAGGVVPAAIAAFGHASLGVLGTSAFGAAMPEVVGRDALLRANGLYASLTQVALAVGFGIGGLLTAAALFIPFVVNAATFAASLTMLTGVPAKSLGSVERRTHESYLHGLAFGVRHLGSNRSASALIAVTSVATIGFAPAIAALPILVQDLGGASVEYGLLLGLTTLGLVVGAMLVGRIQPRHSSVWALTAGLLLMGLLTAGLALAGSLAVLAVLVVLRSSSNSVVSVTSTSMLQEQVANEVRGRVMAVRSALQELPRLAVLPLAGLLIDQYGVRPVYVAMSAVICAAGVLALSFVRVLADGDPSTGATSPGSRA